MKLKQLLSQKAPFIMLKIIEAQEKSHSLYLYKKLTFQLNNTKNYGKRLIIY